MSAGHRARADQSARRVNAAVKLLSLGLSVPQATRRLARRHHLSERQARRYVERARDLGPIEVPGAKVVFTVKLPKAVVRHLRRCAKVSTRTLSALVTQALEESLERMRVGPQGGR